MRRLAIFSTRLGMLEMVFAKADLLAAEYYDQRLVKELWPLGGRVTPTPAAAEIHVVLAIASDSTFDGRPAVDCRVHSVRGGHTDPLNVLQAELLHRTARPRGKAMNRIDASNKC
ncbi:phosphoenolpyruvate carboxylase [Shigella flexneri]